MSNDQLSYELKQSSLSTPNGRRTALVIVDMQNDFMATGPVPYPDTQELVQRINKLRNTFKFNTVVLSKDAHPSNHISFLSHHLPTKYVEPYSKVVVKTTPHLINVFHPNVHFTDKDKSVNQVIYPDHCIAGSVGSEFAVGLEVHVTDVVVEKGTNPLEDSPSLFYDDFTTKTSLYDTLTTNNISEVFICGIGGDTTVVNTALMSAFLGFRTYIVADCCSSLPRKTSSLQSHLTAHCEAHKLPSSTASTCVDFDDETRRQLENAGVVIANLSVLREPRSDPGRETGAYLARQTQLMQQLCAHLAYERPDDPIALIRAKLKEVAETRLLSSLSLLNDADIEVVFGMTDVKKQGWISGEQARRIVWELGLDTEGLLVRNEDRFTCAELKILARRAMERRRHE